MSREKVVEEQRVENPQDKCRGPQKAACRIRQAKTWGLMHKVGSKEFRRKLENRQEKLSWQGIGGH